MTSSSSSSQTQTMEAQEEKPKWEGKVTAKVQGPKPHQVWSVLVQDFCEIHRWLPAVHHCRQVAGVKGEVGAVRCVDTAAPPGSGKVKNWCKERLVSVDHGARCLSYQAMDNNVGIGGYESTMKVLPAADGGGDEAGCCRIEWSYVADPIDGMTREYFAGAIKSHLQGMVENLQKAFPLDS